MNSEKSTLACSFKLIKKPTECLDTSGVVGTVLMDLSKAYDCLSHDLFIAKLAAYGFNNVALRLITDYFPNNFQRAKIEPTFSSYLIILRFYRDQY